MAPGNLSHWKGEYPVRGRTNFCRVIQLATVRPAENAKGHDMTCSERNSIEGLTIRVRMTKETMELFTVPVPASQQEFAFEDQTQVRVLDNPLEDNLRHYVAWGRL